ncbi:SIR2 family NAD-dependent protein deacylase [Pedobacter alluvionis]|uniref:NAD-dependent protein deacylase n=1 Tax=Pedobacter alluvionis TaxID=475253 RepID=A0A497XZN4_9SPHI|nr:Sir2 family NAD-dependent protein deacetylase [Pedobacter alluvionis]RLJ74816.1 NAD-dependent deacetylase [Pedobacter alluvionis]TFB29947.1 NAD-dependent deacylase [Pedobacter alluvionis]
MKIVVLTGAGISAESGLKTFRDADGLWEGYNVYDVATPEAWERNPELVQEFYNERRRQVLAAKPNHAHHLLAELEKDFDVEIITQNIDDLHERAGSTKVTHLHGVITKSQSDLKSELVYPITGAEIKMGELCELGSQLRPHVVWFGEAVPMIEVAAKLCKQAEVFAVIGTSLAVYPAAGLIDFVPSVIDKYIIDPKTPDVKRYKNVINIEKNAVEGVAELKELLSNAR